MRLDHLLSKELLALFGASRRQFTTGCVVLVCSWVEHMTRPLLVVFLLSTSSSDGGNGGEGAGGGVHAVGS